MGAYISEYPYDADPTNRTKFIVRGDPHTAYLLVKRNGVEQDITAWSWRAQVRRGADGPLLFEMTTSVDIPPNGTVPCRLVLHMDEDMTVLLKTGYTFDVEQLTPDHRTWWIVKKMHVTKDVSHG